jgi:VWFA-related protein
VNRAKITRRSALLVAAGFVPSLHAWQNDPPSTFSADVNVVDVLATVRDKDGKIISDLTRGDFTLLEDGRPQAIRYFTRQSDLPMIVGLLVDTSGSERRMLGTERDATRAFLEQVLRPEKDKAFLIHFDHDVELLEDVTSSRERLEKALELLQGSSPHLKRPDNYSAAGGGQTWPGSGGGGWPGGGQGRGRGRGGGSGRGQGHSGHMGTALYDAVYLASDEVMKKQTGRKALILLTDGEDSGSKITLAEAISSCERAETMAYSVRIADDEIGSMRGFGGQGRGMQRTDGKKILQQMSRSTGGAYFEVSKKKTVDRIYGQIEEELRNQYSLGYSSDRPASDAGFRKIALTVNRKGLSIQSRDGYYPSQKPGAKAGTA